ncbi:hypothetical protein Cs7R123_62370 [Catellatospora sp. TT07R-123]|uniref:DUF7919 family protein n=1 Tax=Catellatospora sp. TT07R-123 TaxID=2733863 RepID=UPI001B280CF8|nr:hypothetical protein [Catellatospora sp. TT07R-123]GHJ48895.1 hypothetical protein Cs7R123_62370 [Catellatospora sp. TT07R-123]
MTYRRELSLFASPDVSVIEPWPEFRAVGWLDGDHEFRRGPVPPEAVRRIGWLCVHRPQARVRGFRQCPIAPCQQERGRFGTPAVIDGTEVRLGGAEIRATGPDGQRYSAPDLIHHFITEHGYQPPQEFLTALAAEDIGG